MEEELFPSYVPLYDVQTARSGRWPTLRDHFLTGKKCILCNRIDNLKAHHIRPFHLFPELELEISNLVPLCEGGPWNCHFLAGHLGKSWSHYSENPLTVASEFRKFLLFIHKRYGVQ